MIFQKPRGTLDWIGKDIEQFNRVCEILRAISNLYNIKEIITPTFEQLDLFLKSVGETSDIVTKELYNFVDKGNRNMSLRPEGTAGVVRSYVENKMYANNNETTKLFYIFNLFRYERPQGGRLREFHQFGVEYLNAQDWRFDVEILIFANNILSIFNLEKKVTLKINNLGSFEQRKKWMDELIQYFKNYEEQLTEDSKNRLLKNPLRILDDKIDGKKDFVKNAPKLENFLSNEDKEYFQNICKTLDLLGVKYEIDSNLVRGLDYYTGLVFEFQSNDDNLLGKSTIIGGGRYSNLIKETGGPDYEGIGFAIGIERLLIALNANNYDFQIEDPLDIYIGCENDEVTNIGISIATALRNYGYNTKIDYGVFKKDKNAKNSIKNNARYFIWIDAENIKSQLISVEELETRKRELIKISELKEYFIK